MKFVLLLFTAFTLSTFANENNDLGQLDPEQESVRPSIEFDKNKVYDCRTTIVLAHAARGQRISPYSFSMESFENLKMTPEEFNQLPSSTQESIYEFIMPLKQKVVVSRRMLAGVLSQIQTVIDSIPLVTDDPNYIQYKKELYGNYLTIINVIKRLNHCTIVHQ